MNAFVIAGNKHMAKSNIRHHMQLAWSQDQAKTCNSSYVGEMMTLSS